MYLALLFGNTVNKQTYIANREADYAVEELNSGVLTIHTGKPEIPVGK